MSNQNLQALFQSHHNSIARHGWIELGQPFYQPYSILERTDNKLVVQLNMMVEIELKRKIASYGDEVVVLHPEWLRKDMAQFFQKAVQRYNF